MRNTTVALPRVKICLDSAAAVDHSQTNSHSNDTDNNEGNNSERKSCGGGGGQRSAVVRARYESDVRGVNRYKHFHRPVTVQESFGANAESIDKKLSPRSPRNLSRSPNPGGGDLPQIEANSDSELRKLVSNNKPSTSKSGNTNKTNINRINKKEIGAESGTWGAVSGASAPTDQTAPIVDTWRIRKRPPPLKDGENKSPVQNGIIMMEALLELKQPGKDNPPKTNVLQRQNTGGSTTLPEIIQQKSSNGAGANVARLTQAQKSRDAPQIIDQKYRSRPNLTISLGREASSNLNPSSISRIDAMLTSPSPYISSDISIMTHQSKLGSHDTKVESSSNGIGTNADKIETKKLTEDEKTQRKREAQIQLQQQRYGNRPSPSSTPKPSSSMKRTVEFGTQTDTKLSQESGTFHQNPESNTPTSSTTESTSVLANSDRRTPKATQTDNFNNLFTNRLNNICAENINEIEQRTELLEIIDNALGETIDKESRLLANQFIASSARKQAQVWRDAKEFVSTMLVPYSVELANKARSTRLPFEHIANIQLP